MAELEEETAMEGGEVARELWTKSFRSFRQRSKGESLLLAKVIGAGACCLRSGFAVPRGTCGSLLCLSLDIASAPSLCLYTEFPVSASRCSRLARKTCRLTKALSFPRTLVRWLWRAWRVWRGDGGQSSQRSERLFYFKRRRGPNK